MLPLVRAASHEGSRKWASGATLGLRWRCAHSNCCKPSSASVALVSHVREELLPAGASQASSDAAETRGSASVRVLARVRHTELSAQPLRVRAYCQGRAARGSARRKALAALSSSREFPAFLRLQLLSACAPVVACVHAWQAIRLKGRGCVVLQLAVAHSVLAPAEAQQPF